MSGRGTFQKAPPRRRRASNREQMILTSCIIGTTLTLLVVGSNADTQRPVMRCREVDMNPPMQTAAAIAEVNVRASA